MDNSMINKLRSNKRVRNLIEDFMMLGRTSFNDLDKDERENLVYACVESLSLEGAEEIIFEKNDEAIFHKIIVEAYLAKSNLFRNDALYEIVPEANRIFSMVLKDDIDQLLGEAISEFKAETRNINNYLGRYVFDNRFEVIDGGL